MDPRTPVIVGVGQWVGREADPAQTPEPAELMAQVLRIAADDAGAGDRLLRSADSVQVVNLMSWQYADAPGAVASRIGAEPRERLYTTMGGNTPQMLVNATARRIQAGELDVAVIAGCEVVYTRMLARKQGVHLDWTPLGAGESAPTATVGYDNVPATPTEMTRSLLMPTHVYPIFETAVRAAAGRGVAEHQAWIGGLWSRFSEVAATNPYAWSPKVMTADEIVTPSEGNRMVAFPYTKLLCANIQTDQAAGLILCSVAAAESAGVPRDRWVFPVAGADAHDHWFLSERDSLASSPAIAANGAAALGAAGIGIDDVAHLDIYSCFPSAVEIGAAALGVPVDDPGRPVTLTGGLTFGGGPGNNYATHSIAQLVERLRGEENAYGVTTAVGWYLTKHSLGLYSSAPPVSGFQWVDSQPTVHAHPKREIVDAYEGPATIEAYTVTHERDGSPASAIVAALTPDGTRVWANTDDPAALDVLLREEGCGREAHVTTEGALRLA